MADTFDSRLKLRLQESGANSGQWGTLLNQTVTNIASVFGFGTHQLTSDADATLTLSDDGASIDVLKSSYLKITSSVSLTATRTLTFAPNTLNQVKYIENATSGSQSITISQGSGANITIESGATKVVYFDGAGSGAAVVDALANIDQGTAEFDTIKVATIQANDGTAAMTLSNSSGNVAFPASIDVDGTTNLDVVDIDGAVDMASTLAVAGVVTANAGVVVDNITIDGTEIDLSSGDLTIDVAGDIILDAGGAQLRFHDDGTDIGVISNESNNLIIKSQVSGADLILKGNDGGSSVTALTLDMSAAGAATFNAGATFNSEVTMTRADNGVQLTLQSTDTDANAGPNLKLERAVTGADSDLLGTIIFLGRDDAGNGEDYARIFAQIADASNGTEDGILELRTILAGTEVRRIDLGATETVINEDSKDLDFRVESNADANAFFVNGGDGVVSFGGMGTNTRSPSAVQPKFQANSLTRMDSSISLCCNSNDTLASLIMFSKTRSGNLTGVTAAQAGDAVGAITWNAADGTDIEHGIAAIDAVVESGIGTNDTPGAIRFYTNSGTTAASERLRITGAGHMVQGDSGDPTFENVNKNVFSLGGATSFIVTGNSALINARQASDGNLIQFYGLTNGATNTGNISQSGGTVSYGAFMANHPSEFAGTETEILVGTVMETTGAVSDIASIEGARLPATAISTTEDSNAVYGVYLGTNLAGTADGESEEAGIKVASIGAYFVRVHQSETAQLGDLLSSKGDGTAKVQSDDVIRSRTIGKVVGTVKKQTYDDGSYLLPCVLYCG